MTTIATAALHDALTERPVATGRSEAPSLGLAVDYDGRHFHVHHTVTTTSVHRRPYQAEARIARALDR